MKMQDYKKWMRTQVDFGNIRNSIRPQQVSLS